MAVPNTLLLETWCKQHIKGYARYDVDEPFIMITIIDPDTQQEKNLYPVKRGKDITDRLEEVARHAGYWIEDLVPNAGTIVVDWYAEGQAARRIAIQNHVVSNVDLLQIARHEYKLLRKSVGLSESVDTYRPYINGFYNPTLGENGTH